MQDVLGHWLEVWDPGAGIWDLDSRKLGDETGEAAS